MLDQKWFYVLLAILGGISIAPQGAINAMLGRYVGNLQAAIVSFAVGLLSLLLLSAALWSFHPGNWQRITEAPRISYIGGLLGAIIVFTVLTTVPRIGATPTVISILIGQILSSFVIDHYGLLGVPVMSLDFFRLLGVILLLVALPLVLHG